MKKILLMALLLTMFLGMHAQTGNRMLVTYFSWSGSTKNLAEEIQRQTNADIYRIEPLVPYTDDYQELAYQISNKGKEENARPALKDTLATLNGYDIIFVGCPVWWFDATMIIHSCDKSIDNETNIDPLRHAAHACGWRIMQDKQQEYEQSDRQTREDSLHQRKS